MIDSLTRRVARRYLTSSDMETTLRYYGLSRLPQGGKTFLYHGTTALFSRFSTNYIRKELVDQYYGGGVFLTPRKSVASEYADANRNMGFPPEVIRDLKRANREAGLFMEDLYKRGHAAWDNVDFSRDFNFDHNLVADIAENLHGTKYQEEKSNNDFVDIFSQNTGTPDYLYDNLDTLGVDSFKYRPKIYTCIVQVHNTLITRSKAEARKAQDQGYDSVIFDGEDLVGGVPEVAVFKPQQIKIVKVDPVETTTISGDYRG